jgi:cell division protein FtsA
MKLNEPYLIISLNDNKIIFFIISYNENKDHKLIKSINIDSKGIQNGKIVDVEIVSRLIKKNINFIEDELDHYFSTASVIINPNNINCLNVSGYKKLNGSQVSKEDVTYILNDIKKSILSNEEQDSLVHLFNYSFSLDSDNLENLPIGLFGEFYNQNMTFFLVNKNILKNIKLIFNNCGINIDRTILKPFVEGISFQLTNKTNTNFATISLEYKNINISLFKNRSYAFTQDFDFGMDLIVKDISKLCSLKINEVEFFLKEIDLKTVLENDEDSYLDKVFFSTSPYRKIKHRLILEIIVARLDELIEICYDKNSNLNYLRKSNDTIYIIVDNFEYYKNIQFALQKNKLIDPMFVFGKNIEDNSLFILNGAAELVSKGWDKEAIPSAQLEKSIISAFFSRLFN